MGIGSIECHGRHNALGTDMIIPDKLISMMEDKIDVLIAPTLPYGSTDSLEDFPGTINLSDEVFYQVMKKIVVSLQKHGAKKFVFMNGHGGNVKVLQKICLELDDTGCLGTIINWWLLAWDLNPKWKGGHGGAEETAALMAVDKELVDLKEIASYEFKDIAKNLKQTGYYTVNFKGIDMMIPRKISSITDNGWVGNDHPQNANEKWGKEMLEACAKYIVSYIKVFKEIEVK